MAQMDLGLVRLGTNENILDNWYHIDPINQRGQTTYTGDVCTIDRWAIRTANTDCKMQITDNGILLTSTGEYHLYFFQIIPPELVKYLRGREVCVSLYVVEDTGFAPFITVSVDGNYFNDSAIGAGVHTDIFTVPNNAQNISISITATSAGSVILKAIKLELGSRQTLAHQDASGNWVLNDPPPDKALELAKCQRYLFIPTAGATSSGVAGFGASLYGSVQVNIPTPVPMRVKPSVTLTGNWDVRGAGNRIHFNANEVTIGSSQKSDCYVALDIQGITGLTEGYVYQLTRDGDGTAQIIFSAEL